MVGTTPIEDDWVQWYTCDNCGKIWDRWTGEELESTDQATRQLR